MKIQNWLVFANGNFNLAEVVYLLQKNLGETNVHLYNLKRKTSLITDVKNIKLYTTTYMIHIGRVAPLVTFKKLNQNHKASRSHIRDLCVMPKPTK